MMRTAWLAMESLVCAALFATACASSSVAPSWDDFWLARGVSPAPPRDFLDGLSEPPEILNLTNGALSDGVVRRYSLSNP